MSIQIENEKLHESIPGSSKDTNMDRRDSGTKNDDDMINSVEYLGGERSHIRKTEAFVYMRLPLDGGFAWIVLLTSFLCIVNIDGMRLSIGRIIPFISDDLELNSKKAALIASVQICFYYLCGPFACILIHKIGYRAVSMLGAIMSVVGTLFGSFSTNSTILIIFFGTIGGIGYGMISISTQIIVGFYFEKYRPIATGILCAGSGFGLLIFSPLYNYVAIKYSWRNALRCQSFFALTVLFLTISFHQLKPTKIGQYVNNILVEEEVDIFASKESIEITTRFQNFTEAISEISGSTENSVLPTKSNFLQTNIQKEIMKQISSNKIQDVVKYSSPKNKLTNIFSRICKCKESKYEDPKVTVKKSAVQNDNEFDIHINLNPMDRQDIFYGGKPVYQDEWNKIDYDDITPINKVKSVHYAISVAKPLLKENQKEHRKCISILCKIIYAIFDPVLIARNEFRFLVASSFFFTLGSHVPYLYITEQTDIPLYYANYLLSTIGFTNTIFRITGGFLAYYLNINPLYLAGIPMALSGIFTILTGFFGNDIIWYQFLYCVILGVGFAFYATLKSIIYVKLLGLENLTNSFGCTALISGIASFMGTNFAGFIKSFTGKTNYAFVFAGISLFLGGFIYILLPKIIGNSKNITTDNK